MPDSTRIVYRDGFNEITREEFFALQDRLCAGDPAALAYVLIQQRRAKLAKDPEADDAR